MRTLQKFVQQRLRFVVAMAAVATLGLAGATGIIEVPTLEAAGTNYYVDSVNGNDGNSGTSESSPWRSLGAVQNRSFQPGDTINLKRGSSWNTGLTFGSSGNSGSRITIQAYGTGNRPVLSHPGSNWENVIVLNGSFVTIQGLAFTDTVEAGVRVASGANNNIIQDNEFYNIGTGVLLQGQYNLVTRNYAHDLRMVRNTVGGDDDYGANGVNIRASNQEISYNRIANARATSYDYGYDGGAVELYGSVSNINVHHNTSTGGNGFVEVGGGSASNITIAYNLSDDRDAFAMLHMTGTFASAISNFKMENNTIIRKSLDYRVLNFNGDPNPSQVLFRNNIVQSQTSIANRTSFTHTNNLYSLQNGASLGFSLGSGERQGDPLFANFSGGDYRLRSGSPAIDGGLNLGYKTDLDGNSVPGGSAPDMGSYEFGSSAASIPVATAVTTAVPATTTPATATPVPATATAVPATATPAPTTSAAAPAGSGTASSILADGPLAFWRLGETSGTTARDASGNNYHGSYTNGGYSIGTGGALSDDRAASFNGENGYVEIPSLPSANDFTVEGWSYLYPESVKNPYGNNTIIRAWERISLAARPGDGNGSFQGYYGGVWINGTEYFLQGNTANNVGSWVHWAMVRQGKTLSIYRNGELVNRRSDLPSGSANLQGRLGSDGTNYPMWGKIDEVAIFSKALSQAQIKSHYNGSAQPAATAAPATATPVPPTATPAATSTPATAPTTTTTATATASPTKVPATLTATATATGAPVTPTTTSPAVTPVASSTPVPATATPVPATSTPATTATATPAPTKTAVPTATPRPGKGTGREH